MRVKTWSGVEYTLETDLLTWGHSPMAIEEIRVGDYLAIMNAGAYCRSMASEYNLRPLPSEYLIYNEEVITSKKKLTHEELADRILKDYGM